MVISVEDEDRRLRTVNEPGEISQPSETIMDSPGNEIPNHIEEYLKTNVGENAFRDLLEADENNVDLRTELNENEVDIVNKIFINNEYLKSILSRNQDKKSKLGVDVYGEFLNNYLRLKISFNRASRMEFVDINKKDRFENNLTKFNSFANLQKVKE